MPRKRKFWSRKGGFNWTKKPWGRTSLLVDGVPTAPRRADGKVGGDVGRIHPGFPEPHNMMTSSGTPMM